MAITATGGGTPPLATTAPAASSPERPGFREYAGATLAMTVAGMAVGAAAGAAHGAAVAPAGISRAGSAAFGAIFGAISGSAGGAATGAALTAMGGDPGIGATAVIGGLTGMGALYLSLRNGPKFFPTASNMLGAALAGSAAGMAGSLMTRPG